MDFGTVQLLREYSMSMQVMSIRTFAVQKAFIRCLGRILSRALLELKGHAPAHRPWRCMGVPYDVTEGKQDPDLR